VERKPLTVAEAGRMGGTVRALKARNHLHSKIGQDGVIQSADAHSSFNPVQDSGKMTVTEAGAKGGRKTAETHGQEHYREIGRKGGRKVVEQRGSKFYSEIGSRGGIMRSKQHEGSKEAQGKVSLEEAGRRGGNEKKTNRAWQKDR
jgi:uncharacterized protein